MEEAAQIQREAESVVDGLFSNSGDGPKEVSLFSELRSQVLIYSTCEQQYRQRITHVPPSCFVDFTR